MKRLFPAVCAAALISGSAVFAQQPAPVPPAPAPVQPMPAQPSPPVIQAPAETRDQAAMNERAGPTDNQIADEVDARIAQLKAALRLTPEQDGKWGSLRDSLRDFGLGVVKARMAYDDQRGRRADDMGRRSDRDRSDDQMARRSDRDRNDREADMRGNDLALMRLEADDMARRAEGLRKIASAAEPFYGELHPRQQRMLLRFVDDGFDNVGRTRRSW